MRYDEETGLYVPEPQIHLGGRMEMPELTPEQKIKWALAYIARRCRGRWQPFTRSKDSRPCS